MMKDESIGMLIVNFYGCLFLRMMNTMNIDEHVRVSFPDACLILLAPMCMCFYVTAHVLVHLAFTWLIDWLGALCSAT